MKSLITVIVLAIIIIVAIVMTGPKESPSDTNVNVDVTPTPTATTTPTVTATSTATSTASTQTTAPKTVVVTYTDSGFSPLSVTIKKGDTVTFKNDSTRGFWPASDDHPSHLRYSAFDPKQTVAAGGSWSFKFDQVGTWAYHDHRSASKVGTVIVQ